MRSGTCPTRDYIEYLASFSCKLQTIFGWGFSICLCYYCRVTHTVSCDRVVCKGRECS